MPFRENKRFESPKSPESKGSKGCWTGRLKVRSPRSPERRKIINPRKKSSSLKIIKRERKMRMKGINDFIISKKEGR